MNSQKGVIRVFGLCFFLLFVFPLMAQDWPTYRYDNARSGISGEAISVPLELDWVYQSRQAPMPAWPEPAERDWNWAPDELLKPRVIYDRALHVVSAGDKVYFGSSVNDKVYCLDAKTGDEVWSFFTEGPVRLAPTVYEGKVYVGFDDGFVYCLGADDGSLIWKYKAAEEDVQIPGNERMISLWPVRSSVMIHEGKAIFCAGFFPTQGVYFVSLDAGNGSVKNKEKIGATSQGYLKIQDGKLFTPTGRDADAHIGDLSGDGSGGGSVAAPEGYGYCVIKAGDVVFAGGDNKVGAFSSDGKEELWNAEVTGRVYGLSAANGKLFVSTDKGMIYCFGKAGGKVINKPAEVKSPYKKDKLTKIYVQAAKQIVKATGITKGYCLDLGCGQGRLAYEIAKLTDMQIIGVEEDAGKVAAAREALDEAGLYGRVVVHEGSLEKLPYSKYLFNLIVSDRVVAGGELPGKANEVYRVLRPCGGQVYIGHAKGVRSKVSAKGLASWTNEAGAGEWIRIEEKNLFGFRNGIWATVKRGQLAGAGKWTHQYADPGNTSNGRDELIEKAMQIQWFGKPGPRKMADRHSRPPAPLSVNGRMYVRGEQYLYGVDAYNGTILWEKDMPEMQTRVNIPQDNGYMIADDDYFYAAIQNKCRKMDGQTGKDISAYDMPVEDSEKDLYDWGHLAYEGDTLYGSAVRKNAFYDDAKGPWYDSPGSHHNKICSDFVFALDMKTGKLKWRYDGVIVNSTIAIGGGKVYFAENRNPAIKSMESGRIGGDKLWQDMYLVALDAATGKQKWEKTRHDIPNSNPVKNMIEEDGVLKANGRLWAVVPGDYTRDYKLTTKIHFNGTDFNSMYIRSDGKTGDKGAPRGLRLVYWNGAGSGEALSFVDSRDWKTLAKMPDPIPGFDPVNKEYEIGIEDKGEAIRFSMSEVGKPQNSISLVLENAGDYGYGSKIMLGHSEWGDDVGNYVTYDDINVTNLIDGSQELIDDFDDNSIDNDKWTEFVYNTGIRKIEIVKSEPESKPIGFVPGSVVFDVSYSDDTVILVSSPYAEYNIYAYNASDGEFLWKQESNYRLDGNTWDHGGHMQHPVIVDGVVYQDPHDFDLRTGKKGSMVLTRDGHGCGSLSGTPGYLFGRGGNPMMYVIGENGKSKNLTNVSRPGCWINIIPAGGMVLVPEASSGCSCGEPVQTSFGFVTVN